MIFFYVLCTGTCRYSTFVFRKYAKLYVSEHASTFTHKYVAKVTQYNIFNMKKKVDIF